MSAAAKALTGMHGIKSSAVAFRQKLDAIKARTEPYPGGPWYPYNTFGSLWLIDEMLAGEHDPFGDLVGKRIADIGAADGDLSFFLESLGARCDIIDNGPTNMNGLHGARKIKQELNSAVSIFARDLDQQFDIPGRYDLAIFLGILYHLKNPFYALEKLAKSATHALVSTRVANFVAAPAAYLLDPTEANNDDTNFWVFTTEGFKRLINRTGWEILAYREFGPENAHPADLDKDRRAFCYLRSKSAI